MISVRSLPRFLPCLLPLTIAIVTGWIGLDFGFHWDEDEGQIDPVKTMVRTETLLPHFYDYPSFDYWISLAALIPDALAEPEESDDGDNEMVGGGDAEAPADNPEAAESTENPFKAHLLEALDSVEYRLRVRGAFLVISALAVVWVYLLVLSWRQSWGEATLAASFLALSWEVAYHLRFIATDGILMQFGALTILCAVLSGLRPNSRFWLRLAAVAAGLACGTKYPGGALLLPVLVAAYQARDRTVSFWSLVRLLGGLVSIFAVTYLVTTPGTLLQPTAFWRDMGGQLIHYSGKGYHGGHNIAPGWEHGWNILIYLSLTLFSRYAWIGLPIFALALIGGGSLVRESPRRALLFLIFPILYSLYFSLQGVLLVRNLLVVAPFLAILAAQGAAVLWHGLARFGTPTLPRRGAWKLNYLQAALALTLLAFLSINAGWLVYAAGTIADRGTEDEESERFIREAAAYISHHPDTRFFLSERVRERLNEIGSGPFANATTDPHQADVVVFYTDEGVHATEEEKSWVKRIAWPANRRHFTVTWFGPYEINYDYYPSWDGDERIIVMSRATALQIGVVDQLAASH